LVAVELGGDGMSYNWDWGVLLREPYLDWLISGFGWTITVSLAAWVLAFSLGSVIGILRTTDIKFLRAFATAYVELFRNIPLLVQMFLWYFVFPELLPNDLGMWVKRDLPMPEFTTAAVCLGLYTASRVAEQVRAGINAIGQGQRNAGLAMGLTPTQVYRYVLLPVSYRIIVPPLTSEFLTIFKNSSVALTIGVLETTAQARQIEEYTFQGFEAFTAATVLYILVTSIVMLLMRLIEGRVRIPGMISLGAQ
jgi:glutamate/aspartate transport system permease protein